MIRIRREGSESEEIYLSMSFFFFDTDSSADNNYCIGRAEEGRMYLYQNLKFFACVQID